MWQYCLRLFKLLWVKSEWLTLKKKNGLWHIDVPHCVLSFCTQIWICKRNMCLLYGQGKTQSKVLNVKFTSGLHDYDFVLMVSSNTPVDVVNCRLIGSKFIRQFQKMTRWRSAPTTLSGAGMNLEGIGVWCHQAWNFPSVIISFQCH